MRKLFYDTLQIKKGNVMIFKGLVKEEEDITEQSIAIKGDWSAKDDLGSKSTFMLAKEFGVMA